VVDRVDKAEAKLKEKGIGLSGWSEMIDNFGEKKK